ncbi:hypothetical protein [Saccharopolyspora hattusasensis]|uniref:hypothetical protein n=1 Tax=Saccharopolyspora hattusasensis TaxID=1128679 RepID=UPI003D98BD9B
MIDQWEAYRMWAEAHVFFHNPYTAAAVTTSEFSESTDTWRRRLVHETPNGALLVRNTMFDALSGHKKLYLLHVTHALEKITEHGVIYPSGGCLVGSVYCTPLTQTGQGFRMHNLGKYVLTKEAPAFAKKLGAEAGVPEPLIIELTIPSDGYRGLAGIDYLRLGLLHLRIFEHLEYLLSRTERHQLRELVTGRIKNSTGFLGLCCGLLHGTADVGAEDFLRALDQIIPTLPILGYLYFEALAEYVMLHSTSNATAELREIGELNNWLYKELLFSVFPRMGGKFDLSKFRPQPHQLGKVLRRVDRTLDVAHAMRYLRDRISYLVNARLLSAVVHPEDWHCVRWEFDDLRKFASPLIGHLIHRELRSFGRYPDFYFYYDQHKALQVWNYWNHMDIVAPFNGTIPKGEVGVNPAYPDLKYSIHRAELGEDGLLHRSGKLHSTIAPRLVDIKYSLMRTRSWSGRSSARSITATRG